MSDQKWYKVFVILNETQKHDLTSIDQTSRNGKGISQYVHFVYMYRPIISNVLKLHRGILFPEPFLDKFTPRDFEFEVI